MVAAHNEEVLELNSDGTFELPATPTAAHVRKQQEVDACAAKQSTSQQPPAAPAVIELLHPQGGVAGYQITVETGDATLQAEQVKVAVSSRAEVVISWGAKQTWHAQLPKSNIDPSSTKAWLNSGRIIAHVLLL
jgi:hypothetical protein